ncbi:dihydrolipoyl dehydrogenase [Zooshikella harenae]|uniref:Dihydrolipoyl dehydrogenase n=1 Tax=Zooshikella harenae TaxID=2827238 RepID=A0ABS5ZH36_9GAMM|nr:dihydrolipoyl dehydrogenase [Zooshikella harenae]MBU2712591.1 dihydrolipoyl dehydrogenase [Zooshikella harenae]
MKKSKLILATSVAIAIALFFLLDIEQYLSVSFFQSLYDQNPIETALIFFVIYVAVTGLSLPGAALMTLVAGVIFGLLHGTILVSFASTIGATLAFLLSRTLLHDWVQSRFSNYLKTINQGIHQEGTFYLFTLRLIPAIPFFVINLVMGLTPIRTGRFFIVSQVGMLPGTIVYVGAGASLTQVEELSIKGVLQPEIIIAFLLLGIFPWLAKAVISRWKEYKVLKPYPRPTHFDTNLLVIGAGSAGLVSAYIAAAVKAKVMLIERYKMGGDCLNTGCVPSKALLRSAKMAHYFQRAEAYGIVQPEVHVDFAKVMERVHQVIQKVEPHDSIERYTALGVECVTGTATIKTPYSVDIDGKTITTKNIIIASGGRPVVPPIPGLDAIDYYTSDTIWRIRERPERMLVIGGGPIGCELTQAFARLGVNVTQVDIAPRLMPREDEEVSALIQQKFIEEGIEVLVAHKPVEFYLNDGQKQVILEADGEQKTLSFDLVLVAVGRQANTANLGLDALGIALTERGTLAVNDYLQTKFPNIYACGDVAGPYQFTHTASHQAWYAAVNALFRRFKKFKVNYNVIPWATFTDPEVARVGLNEQEAQERNIAYEVSRYNIDDLDRAIADEEAHGFVKVLTVPGKDTILGVTIVGYHASELITEYISAMKHGLGLNKILGTIHIYPTLSEANKYAAGVWKKAHAPAKLLNWLARYHQWERQGKHE